LTALIILIIAVLSVRVKPWQYGTGDTFPYQLTNKLT